MRREPASHTPEPSNEFDGYPIDERGYTDTKGAAKYYGVSVSKVNKDRHFGVGAEWVLIGRAVRYSYAALDIEAAKHRRDFARSR